MFKTLVVAVAAAAALTLSAAPAVAAPAAPRQAGTTNSCANPVLAQGTTGWSVPAGAGTSTRQAATGHPSAPYAFWALFYAGSGTITLPPQAVAAGQQGSYAFDSQLPGSVRASVEFYSAAGARLSRVDGPSVAGTASTWVRAAVTATAPAGATRAAVLGTATLQQMTWWKSTACTYTLAGAPPVTTTTTPPTTTTVPPTTTTTGPPTTTTTTTTQPPTTTTTTTTTQPPTTTTAPPTTTTPTTPPPANPGDGTQAATRYGWGQRVDGDEFSGTSVDLNKWALYDSPGHAGNGLRRPSQISVNNGVLTINGDAAGTTGGMSMHNGRLHGRWEARMQIPRGDHRYHPVLLLWPDAEDWPIGGEVDYAETTAAARQIDFFLHYGADNRTTTAVRSVDLTQWHNYAVEWTPSHIKGYVDGVQYFVDTNRSHLPPRSMHQTIQLDWFPNGTTPTTPSQMNVAWIRIYRV